VIDLRKIIGRCVCTVLTGIALLSVGLTAEAQKSGGLTLTFSPREVTVSGIERGQQIVLFGIGIGRLGSYPLLTRDAKVLTDDDGDGVATARFYQVPVNSVWVTVDADTGRYTMVTPTGVTPTPLDVPDWAWRGNHTHVDVDLRFVEALVVRPRIASWRLSIAEGGRFDGDGVNNGLSRLSLDRMNILSGQEKGPGFLIPRDLIVLIDPFTLDTFIGEAQ
jgi:hypothetical protein